MNVKAKNGHWEYEYKSKKEQDFFCFNRKRS